MSEIQTSGMNLKLELFVEDIEASKDFYTRVLGFKIGRQEAGGYVALRRGEAHLALNLRSNLRSDHPVRADKAERHGRGVEIVLEVDDVETTCKEVQTTGWPLSSKLRTQPWGLTDFRVADPDGYYLRVSSR